MQVISVKPNTTCGRIASCGSASEVGIWRHVGGSAD
jgi:hypothetical protein